MKLLQSNIQPKHSSPMPCYLEDINFQISSKNRTICSIPSFAAPLLEAQPSESEAFRHTRFNTWSIEYNENDRIWPTLVSDWLPTSKAWTRVWWILGRWQIIRRCVLSKAIGIILSSSMGDSTPRDCIRCLSVPSRSSLRRYKKPMRNLLRIRDGFSRGDASTNTYPNCIIKRISHA
jgi:hypothetical protein